MSRDFWVHVYGQRAADFIEMFGTRRVPVRSPRPGYSRLPGSDEPQRVYLLDLEWVSEQGHRQRLVEHIAAKFNLPADEVERDLDAIGMPVLEAGTVLEIANLQRYIA